MSIRYDTIRDGVIIFSFVMAFFFVNFLEFSGLCGIFGRRSASYRTGLLASTFFCWFGLLFFWGEE